MAAAARDVSHQSNIAKMRTDGDGSFKRLPSTFRSAVEKGGQFPPEKGPSLRLIEFTMALADQ